MTVIVKCDIAAIIGINPVQCNDGSPEIAADVFNDSIRITELRLGINVKTIFIFAVDKSLGSLERGPNAGLEEIQEGGLKGFAKECVVEMFNNPPEAAFGNETVDIM